MEGLCVTRVAFPALFDGPLILRSKVGGGSAENRDAVGSLAAFIVVYGLTGFDVVRNCNDGFRGSVRGEVRPVKLILSISFWLFEAGMVDLTLRSLGMRELVGFCGVSEG